MSKQTLQKKILDLENEVRSLRRAVTNRPNFEVDEKQWKKVRGAAKKARTETYSREYGKK